MDNNSDLFTPLPVELSTPNELLYQFHETEKYLKNDFYTFDMDGFTVPGIDDEIIPQPLVSLSPITAEPDSLEPLFPPVPSPTADEFVIPETIKQAPQPPIKQPKQISCDLCEEIFFSTQALRLHRRVQHISKKEFRCRKCPASFNLESNLLLHLASHVSSCSTNKQCPQCKMIFKRTSTFKGHLKMHQTNDKFTCKRCDKEFELKCYYEKHMAKAHKSGALGTVEEILKVAKNTKYRRPPNPIHGKYNCQYCSKKFSKPCLLKRHEVCHTGAKPFQCTDCDRGFTQKSSLDRHMLLHQGVKHYKCPMCNYSFFQKNNLIVHIQRTHPLNADGGKTFPCDFCPCLFSKERSLNRHRARMHPEKVNRDGQDGLNIECNENDDDEVVNVAKVMEQLKSFQESMGITDETTAANTNDSANKTETVQESLNKEKPCSYCSKRFKTKYDLLRHQRTHTNEKPFQCNICNKKFSTNSGLKTHTTIHGPSQENPTRAYDCLAENCHKKFTSMRTLDIHTKRTHLNFISYVCTVCSKTFSSKAGFSAHTHLPKDPELESIRDLLQAPVQIKSNAAAKAALKAQEYAKRSHQCSVCGLKMQKLSHLRQHEATHTGAKPFQCEICFRSYTTQSSLNLHMKIHTADKTHICNICNAKFFTRFFLNRHMICHSDERNFACPYCDERFKSNDNCKNHILTHARSLLASPEPDRVSTTPRFPVEQPDRGEDFITQQYIAVVESPQKNLSPKFLQLELVKNCKKHKHRNLTIETLNSPKSTTTSKIKESPSKQSSSRKMTETTHPCDKCDKVFLKASDLKRHTRTHTKEKPYQCGVCSRQFALMSTLVHHMKIHDEQRETFDCQVCGKKYTSQKVLTVHLRIHTGERPFQCGVCLKTFRTSGHKISHVKTHHKKKI